MTALERIWLKGSVSAWSATIAGRSPDASYIRSLLLKASGTTTITNAGLSGRDESERTHSTNEHARSDDH
jgi:hypothetical protein